MSGWTPRQRAIVIAVIVVLLLFVSFLRGCSRPPDIIVRMKDEGKHLTTGADGDTTLLYNSEKLTIFNGLTDRQHLLIRQSFPEFSRRWQEEIGWRSGRNDSVAVALLDSLAGACLAAPPADRQAVERLADRWQGDHAAVLADTAAVSSLKRLVLGRTTNVPADSARVVGLIGALQADGTVMGERDSLAILAISSLLSQCPGLAHSDSASVFGFVRRIRADGGVGGIAGTAIESILDLTRSEPIELRDSLTVASWVRLLAGDGVFGPTLQPATPDLWLRIRVLNRKVDVDKLIEELERIPEVESAVRAFPDAKAAPAGRASPLGWLGLASRALAVGVAQPYQGPAPIGIGANYAWEEVAGGDGSAARVMVLDSGYYADHPGLPDNIHLIGAVPAGVSTSQKSHGTKTLGLLVAKDNTQGGKGTAFGAKEVCFTSVAPSGPGEDETDSIRLALDRAATHVIEWSLLGDLSPAILVIEAQLETRPAASGCGSGGGPSPGLVPVEANGDIRDLIRTLVFDLKVTVVEAAGNGDGRLVPLAEASPAGTRLQWDPNDPAEDSGATLVGAGEPGTDDKAHARWRSSNYGDRVDCQGWGWGVQSTSVENEAPVFDADFRDTSAATAIVGGLVTCYQSAHFAKHGSDYPVYPPTALRALLRDEAYGTAQHESNKDERVGPLPDLEALLRP